MPAYVATRPVPEYGVTACPSCLHYLPSRVGLAEVTCAHCGVTFPVDY